MTNQQSIDRLLSLSSWWDKDSEQYQAIVMAISALQAQDSHKPTAESVQNVQNEDSILRKAAIDAIKKYMGDYELSRTMQQVMLLLPSAQPYVPDTNVGSMISRQAAIDTVKNMRKVCDTEDINDYYDLLLAAFDVLPSAQPEPHWIPVSERLPEVGKDVMVCYDFKGYRSVLIGVLYGDEKFHGYDDEYLTPEGRKYRKAVAWMPLPEPYRAERRTDKCD